MMRASILAAEKTPYSNLTASGCQLHYQIPRHHCQILGRENLCKENSLLSARLYKLNS